jgi:hypothetical protein
MILGKPLPLHGMPSLEHPVYPRRTLTQVDFIAGCAGGIFLLPLPCGWHPIDKIHSSLNHPGGVLLPNFNLWRGTLLDTKWNAIDRKAKEIKDTLTDFILNHSSIEPRRFEEVTYFTPEGDRSYDFLDDAGRKVQSSLLKSYKRFTSTLHPLVKDQPEDVLSKMSKRNEVIMRTIEHKLTWCENTQQALDLALEALEDQLTLVKAICEEKSRKE